jgi:hypothetical protein
MCADRAERFTGSEAGQEFNLNLLTKSITRHGGNISKGVYDESDS